MTVYEKGYGKKLTALNMLEHGCFLWLLVNFNRSDTECLLGLRKKNYCNLEFLKMTKEFSFITGIKTNHCDFWVK